MSTYQEMMYCAACEKLTLHLRYRTSHILHLLLALISVGLWIPVWLLVTYSNSLRNQCTVCGRTLNWGSDARPAKVIATHTPREQKTLEELLRDENA